MNPSFCSLTVAKQSLQYTRKTDLIGPPMPKFEANMNYIPQSPPRSMKQCNKSATVKFHMELLLTTTSQKQSHSGTTPYRALVFHKHSSFSVLFRDLVTHVAKLTAATQLTNFSCKMAATSCHVNIKLWLTEQR